MAKNYSLTAAERETVILLSDDSDIARVSTHQRRVITRLRNNPAAVEVEDLSHGSTPGAIFEIPAAFVSFRSKRRQATPGSGDASKLRGAA